MLHVISLVVIIVKMIVLLRVIVDVTKDAQEDVLILVILNVLMFQVNRARLLILTVYGKILNNIK